MQFTVVQFDYLQDVDLSAIQDDANAVLVKPILTVKDVWAIAEFLDLADAEQVSLSRARRRKFIARVCEFISEHLTDDSLVATWERSAILFDVYQELLDDLANAPATATPSAALATSLPFTRLRMA